MKVGPDGTATVDPVDELIQLDRRLWRFIDTAGLREGEPIRAGEPLARVG